MRLLGLILLACQLAALPAGAQTTALAELPCHDYAEIKRQLGSSYDETVVSSGLQTNGDLLQVFASTQARTWTIVSTTPAGLACILAAGRGWDGAIPAAGRGV